MSIAYCVIVNFVVIVSIYEYTNSRELWPMICFVGAITLLPLLSDFRGLLSTWCLFCLTVVLSLTWCGIAGLAIDKVCSRVEAGKKVQRSKS